MKVIDLFSGCGGLSLGFLQDGYAVKKALEFDENIANSYKLNHASVEMIIEDIQAVDIKKWFRRGEASVIIGGPPCQGFSMAGARIRNGFIDDSRNYLFKQYFQIVKTVMPEIFIMENVKGIITMQDGRILEEIMELFSNRNLLNGTTYNLNIKLVNSADFGIPQKRERVLIIGTKSSKINFDELWAKTHSEIQLKYPDYFDRVTVEDAISNLPKTTKTGDIKRPKPISSYQNYLSCDDNIIKNHTQTNHSKLVRERMSKIGKGENYKVLEEDIKSVHSGAYGRLSWNELAPTITTRFDTPAGGRFIHPVENRTLSPREAARIQSFPDNFIFYGNRTSINKQIGNAVPPKIAYFLARLTRNILNEEMLNEPHPAT